MRLNPHLNLRLSLVFRRSLDRLSSPWLLIGGGGALALAMLSICAVLLYEGRGDALQRSTDASLNTLLVLERDIERNINIYDLSLQAIVDGVGRPDVNALPLSLRRDLLFDRAATASGLGSILVLDKDGRVILDSRTDTPPQGSFAGRRYFSIQRDNPANGRNRVFTAVST